MRVMVIVKASKESEAGQMPSPQLLADMGKFNQELTKAGVMLAGFGLSGLALAVPLLGESFGFSTALGALLLLVGVWRAQRGAALPAPTPAVARANDAVAG